MTDALGFFPATHVLLATPPQEESYWLERGLLTKAPRVVPIPTSDYPTPAARPAYSVLDTSAIQRDFGIALPDWRAALDATLDRMQPVI